MTKVDKETHEMLSDADHVINMEASQGWRIVKTKLDGRILDLQNINNLDFATQETVLFDLKARKMAADLLFAWLRDDVYGFIDQNRSNSTSFAEKKIKDDFIDRA